MASGPSISGTGGKGSAGVDRPVDEELAGEVARGGMAAGDGGGATGPLAQASMAANGSARRKRAVRGT